MPDAVPTIAELGWQAWVTLGVVALATIAMAREKLGPDLVMFAALCTLVVAGILEPDIAVSGFAETAVLTIGVLFVCTAAMRETGALQIVSRMVFGRARSPESALLRLVVPTAIMSAFMNNTPIVAMFIPMVRTFAQRIGLAPSRLLIPLAYATMFGGTCTLIGTSSNLVVSSQLARSDLPAMGMLEIGWIGLPSSVVGILYLLAVHRWLLPDRQDLLVGATEHAREYLAEVEVAADAPLIGRTVEEAGLRHLPDLFLVEIRRTDGRVVRPVSPQDVLRAGDHLLLSGEASTVSELLASFPGLIPAGGAEIGERGLFEVVVSHQSTLVNLTVKEADFRRRFDAAILAVHRSGERIEGRIGDIVLRPGDTLILSASPGFRRTFRSSPLFYLVSDVLAEAPPRYRKANLTLLTLLGLVIVPACTGISMLESAMGALVLLLVVFQCISVRGARESVNWTVLVLIGSAFGVAAALDRTGAAAALGRALVDLTAPLGPRGTLAAVYLCGVVFASVISNAAAAALLFPIAATAAQVGGHDPRPFAIALAMACSAGFSTPIGCQPNLLVYGPGNYRYLDFTRVGLPLNALFFVLAVGLIPVLWPFAS